MAPARKRKRPQLVESGLAAGEGHDNRSSDHIPPVSILKDAVASFPSVKPLSETDETEQLNLRRKTYFIHGADRSEENEPCVIHHAEGETSKIMDDKIRRLTYVVTPFSHDYAESPLVKCNPGKEMAQSEMEITGIQLQPPTLQDLKPKKRGGKKSVQALQEDSTVMAKSENTDDKKENESLLSNAPAGGKPRKRGLKKKSASSKNVQVKALESENEMEIPTVKAKGRRKKAQGQDNETIPPNQKKPGKRGKKNNAE